MKLYFSPILLKKHVMVSMLTDISLPDLFGLEVSKERDPTGKILFYFAFVKFICIVAAFVGLF